MLLVESIVPNFTNSTDLDCYHLYIVGLNASNKNIHDKTIINICDSLILSLITVTPSQYAAKSLNLNLESTQGLFPSKGFETAVRSLYIKKYCTYIDQFL